MSPDVRTLVSDERADSREVIGRLCPNRYFFLFQANLDVTNIQYAELFSSLKSALPSSDGVMTLEVFRSIWSGYKADSTLEPGNIHESLLSTLEQSLSNVLIVEPFFTSCIVHSPWEIDLEPIISRSGYLHSCGPLIYSDRPARADRSHLGSSLRSYLQERASEPNESSTKPLVQFFTRESFPPTDWREGNEEDGISGVKLDYSKSFFGWRPISVEAKLLASELEDLATFDHDYFIREHKAEDNGHETVRENTIFILKDHQFASLSDHTTIVRLESEQYYHCYDSRFRKNNRIHLRDEQKPYWSSATTTPQRLIGAMINLTQPYPGSKICDPFIGTGTSAIEASQWPCTFYASDIFEHKLSHDNVCFYEMTPIQLSDCWKDAESFLTGSMERSNSKNIGEAILLTLSNSEHSPYLEISESLNDIQNTSLAKSLDKLGFIDLKRIGHRIGLYIYRRLLILNNATEIDDLVMEILDREISEWRDYIKVQISVRRKEMSAQDAGESYFPGRFARQIPYIKSDQFSLHEDSFLNRNVNDLSHIDNGSIFAVIADPPYGFNTNRDNPDLLIMYQDMVTEFFRILDPAGGHLVLCVPSNSRSGKYIPTFCQDRSVKNMVARKANELG